MKFTITIYETHKDPVINSGLLSARKVYARLRKVNFDKQKVYLKVDYQKVVVDQFGEKTKLTNEGFIHSIEEAHSFIEASIDPGLIELIEEI